MTAEALLQQEFGCIPALVRAHAQERPGHPALIRDERVLDYAALDATMDCIAASLQRDGLGSGDAIAICATAGVEYAAVFLGALRAGVVVAPLAPSATAESFAIMLSDSKAKILFLDESVAALFAGSQLPAKHVSLDGSSVGQPLHLWLMPAGARPAPVRPPRRSGTTPRAIASSAPGMSAASMPTAFSRCWTAART
jgi:long-chain acyl-CoA synthetase